MAGYRRTNRPRRSRTSTGVDWLLLPTSHGAEHYVAYTATTHLAVDIPHAYLPADILPALSPLVTKYG